MCVECVSHIEIIFISHLSPKNSWNWRKKGNLSVQNIADAFLFYYSGDALKSPKISIFIDCVRESEEKFQILSISAALYERETELDLFSFLLQKGT